MMEDDGSVAVLLKRRDQRRALLAREDDRTTEPRALILERHGQRPGRRLALVELHCGDVSVALPATRERVSALLGRDVKPQFVHARAA